MEGRGEVQRRKGCQYLHPAKYQSQEILSLVVGKRSIVKSTKSKVRSITKRTKNNESTIGTRERDASGDLKSQL